MPPRILKTSFMLERWLEDRQLDVKLLSKRAGVSSTKAHNFIYKRDHSIKHEDVLKLQVAAIDTDKELFQYLYEKWL